MHRLLHCQVEDSFPEETIKPFYKEIIFYFGLHLKCEGTMQISQQFIIQPISAKSFHLFEALLFFQYFKKHFLVIQVIHICCRTSRNRWIIPNTILQRYRLLTFQYRGFQHVFYTHTLFLMLSILVTYQFITISFYLIKYSLIASFGDDHIIS